MFKFRKKKEEEFKDNLFKVSAKTNPGSLAGAIAEVLRKDSEIPVTAQAIGAGAINQLVKAIAISRGFLAPTGKDVICIPGFADVDIEGETRTGIQFSIMLI